MLGKGASKQLPTVLLIDDDMVSREVMAVVLTMGGYTVHTAVNGPAALDSLALGACAPDVILMDAHMPGLSGARLIGELRARSQAAVIAISASAAPDAVESAADGFLLKPFGSEELHRLLDDREAQTRPATPQPEPDLPVIGPETLAQLRGLMPPAAVRQIYAALVDDLQLRIPALQAAVVAANLPEIRRIAHAIKGGCGMAGALQIAGIAARLEALKPASYQLEAVTPLLAELRSAAMSLERMLDTEFAL